MQRVYGVLELLALLGDLALQLLLRHAVAVCGS